MPQLTLAPDRVEIVLTLVDLVKEALNAQACAVFSSAPDRRAVRVQAATGWRAESHGPIKPQPNADFHPGRHRTTVVRPGVEAGDFEGGFAQCGGEYRRTVRNQHKRLDPGYRKAVAIPARRAHRDRIESSARSLDRSGRSSQLATALLNQSGAQRCDAMPGGGKLTLQSANLGLHETFAGDQSEPSSTGRVMIAVTDTGTGIPAAIRDKVLEPFFTTKEAQGNRAWSEYGPRIR
jgi:hypothetical protein